LSYRPISESKTRFRASPKAIDLFSSAVSLDAFSNRFLTFGSSLAYGSVATLTGQTSVDGAVSRRRYDNYTKQDNTATDEKFFLPSHFPSFQSERLWLFSKKKSIELKRKGACYPEAIARPFLSESATRPGGHGSFGINPANSAVTRRMSCPSPDRTVDGVWKTD